jgi:hypothetical protein
MSEQKDTIGNEFPEFADKIHYLKMSNAHFKKLLEKHTDLSRAVERAEQRIDLLSEEAEDLLRKERLVLKDEIYGMLKAHY